MDEIQIKGWDDFFQQVFGFKEDFSAVEIPEKKKDFNRLIIVPKGLTLPIIFPKIMSFMPAFIYLNNLNGVNSARKTDKDYAFWIRDNIEADKNLEGKSDENLRGDKLDIITLEEHLLFTLKYFWETHKHLDVKFVTLCAGSLDMFGSVPFVYYEDSAGLVVRCCKNNFFNGELRGRQVIL